MNASSLVLGIDIGGTNIRLALVDQTGKIHSSHAQKVATLDPEHFERDFLELVHPFVEQAGSRLRAIGMGVPGIVNRAGQIVSCPNITVLERGDLGSRLRDKYGIPVYIEKDVNFILYGDYRALQLQSETCLIGFYIGTGFGCSMLLNGDIYRGTRGFAGELGHIPLKGHHDKCNCGNTGCLELYGAGRSLQERSAKQKQAVSNFFDVQSDRKQVEDFLEYMAIGILTTVNLLDPEIIVIGGGVVEMDGFPWVEFTNRIQDGLRADAIRADLRIIKSGGEVFGGCLGAAYYCFDHIIAK